MPNNDAAHGEGARRVQPAYQLIKAERELAGRITQLLAQTVVLDVEPLIAPWKSSQRMLDEGIASMLRRVGMLPEVRVLCFATNSAREPSVAPHLPGKQVIYLASARKPLNVEPYLTLPRPGVVIGDQVVTDGLLARRIGYTFLHLRPALRDMPVGPLLLRGGGELLMPLLFAQRKSARA